MRNTNKKISKVLIGSLLVSLGAFGLMGLVKDTPGREQKVVNIDELMKKVLSLNEQKQYQKAVDLLLDAVKDQEEDSLLRALLVQTFDLFLTEEIRRGQENIRNDRKDQSAYLSVSGALELLGDQFRAMEVLLNGVAQKPSADLWMRIASLELKAGRDLEALDVYLEVTRIDGKNSLAHNNAAFILAQSSAQNDFKKALKHAQLALKLDPKNPQYIDTLATIYFRKGEESVARNLLKEAIKLAPANEDLRDRLESFDRTDNFLAK